MKGGCSHLVGHVVLRAGNGSGGKWGVNIVTKVSYGYIDLDLVLGWCMHPPHSAWPIDPAAHRRSWVWLWWQRGHEGSVGEFIETHNMVSRNSLFSN